MTERLCLLRPVPLHATQGEMITEPRPLHRRQVERITNGPVFTVSCKDPETMYRLVEKAEILSFCL